MDALGSGSVNTNYGSYSDYEFASAGVSAETGGAAETGSAVSDCSSIGSFNFGKGAGDLNDLYSQKSQAESELGGITAQKNETQTKIYTRKQELTQMRQGGEEYAVENEALGSAQEAYAQTVSARDKAQQELNQVKQESSANAQAISSNAQQQSSVSSEISSLQSQLASLKSTPKNTGGDDGESDGSSAAGGCEDLGGALQEKIDKLQGQMQQLKTEAAKLQNEKAQLDRELNSKQNEVTQLDTAVEIVQSSLDEYYQIKTDEDADLENDFAMDGELRELQNEFQTLQQQEAEKQAEVVDINARLEEAEANDAGLQTVREEAADQAFKEAAAQLFHNEAENNGFDIAAAESRARSKAAEEEYGKPYEELTEEEKLSIEARVDGEVTLEAMELARQKLEEEPDNAAAQAVIERGADSLGAQGQLTQTLFYNSMDNLPESMREGAAAAMDEARRNAGEGEDPEAVAIGALARYIADDSDSAGLNPGELAALDIIVRAAGDYADALEAADKGAVIVDKAADACAKSDLAAMKADLAARTGVSPDQLIVLSGTDGNDSIWVEDGKDGGLCVVINGEKHYYTAEEAKYLIIDGGAGDDTFWNGFDEDSGFTQGLHIFGGDGRDEVEGFSGDNMIYGGAGKDDIAYGDGNNIISGGDGDDHIYVDKDNGYVGSGNNIIDGGSGKNHIVCGDGDNIITVGDGQNRIVCGDGNNIIQGGAGKDDITCGGGNNFVDGGGGDDDIYIKGDGNNIVLAGGGDDDIFIDGGGKNLLLGEDGNDRISGGSGSEIIDGGAGENEIYGGEGDEDYAFTNEGDTVYLPNGQESLKIEGQPGITREFFDPEYVAGRLHAEDFMPGSGDSEEAGNSAADDPAGKVIEVIKSGVKPAMGVKKIVKGVNLYNKVYNGAKVSSGFASKILGSSSKLAGIVSKYGSMAGNIVGGGFGFISLVTGTFEVIEGINNHEGQKTVSGGLKALSGGLALAAAFSSACPPAAAGLWIASGACQVASHIVDYAWSDMEKVALAAMYLLFEDEIGSVVFEDKVRELAVERYGDRLNLINSPQP